MMRRVGVLKSTDNVGRLPLYLHEIVRDDAREILW